MLKEPPPRVAAEIDAHCPFTTTHPPKMVVIVHYGADKARLRETVYESETFAAFRLGGHKFSGVGQVTIYLHRPDHLSAQMDHLHLESPEDNVGGLHVQPYSPYEMYPPKS